MSLQIRLPENILCFRGGICAEEARCSEDGDWGGRGGGKEYIFMVVRQRICVVRPVIRENKLRGLSGRGRCLAAAFI